MKGLHTETAGTLTHPCGVTEEVTVITDYIVMFEAAHLPRVHVEGQKHNPSECDACRGIDEG